MATLRDKANRNSDSSKNPLSSLTVPALNRREFFISAAAASLTSTVAFADEKYSDLWAPTFSRRQTAHISLLAEIDASPLTIESFKHWIKVLDPTRFNNAEYKLRIGDLREHVVDKYEKFLFTPDPLKTTTSFHIKAIDALAEWQKQTGMKIEFNSSNEGKNLQQLFQKKIIVDFAGQEVFAALIEILDQVTPHCRIIPWKDGKTLCLNASPVSIYKRSEEILLCQFQTFRYEPNWDGIQGDFQFDLLPGYSFVHGWPQYMISACSIAVESPSTFLNAPKVTNIVSDSGRRRFAQLLELDSPEKTLNISIYIKQSVLAESVNRERPLTWKLNFNNIPVGLSSAEDRRDL